MKKHYWLGVAVLCFAALAAAKKEKALDWVRDTDEAAQLDPMDYHAGRVYRPGSQGGNLHVDIQSSLPVTISLAPNDEGTGALQPPGVAPRLEMFCMREHVVDTTYE